MTAWLRIPAIGLALVATAGAAQEQALPRFAWTRAYVGQPARQLAADSRFAALVQAAVPDFGVRMGRDANLAAAFTTQIGNSDQAVQLSADRYLSFSGYRADGGASKTFFWVDLKLDRTLGAVYVQLANEWGAPSLLVFSLQQEPIGETARLPAEFAAALADWQQAVGLPLLLPVYFVNPQGENLMLHSAAACPAGASAAASCESANRDAAEIDLAAALAVLNRRAPRGAAALAREENDWMAQRDHGCAAPDAGNDCVARATRQRAQELQQRMPGPWPVSGAGAGAAAGAVTTDPVSIYAPDPSYTDAARRARIEGEVEITLIIGADGTPSAVQPVTHLGYGLDEAAVAAVERWRWRPATRNGVPVAVSARITVSFHLGG